MSKLKPIQKTPDDAIEGYIFNCPACEIRHEIYVEPHDGLTWDFNGDVNKPTFTPSLRIQTGKYIDDGKSYVKLHCHSQITDGKIKYYGDCSHEMKGKEIEIPEIE